MEPSIAKVAWLFPGQGSQQVGMGQALSEKSTAAREVFEKADAILRRPLSEICFRGPEEVLRQTINTQPAILTVSLACLAAAREQGEFLDMPGFLAGHSLGEYTAAVASGRALLRRRTAARTGTRPSDAGSGRGEPGHDDRCCSGWTRRRRVSFARQAAPRSATSTRRGRSSSAARWRRSRGRRRWRARTARDGRSR